MFETIDYNHEAPANTLGTQVPSNTDNVVEALLSAGVPFAAPVKHQMATLIDGRPVAVPDRYNLIDENGRVVGTDVTDRYTPIGFGESLGFLDELCLRGSEFELSRIIDFSGRRLFVSLKMTGCEIDATGNGDIVTPYLNIRTSHDSSCATEAFMSLERMKCSNQMALFKALAKQMGLPHVSVRHTRNARERLQLASQVIANCQHIVLKQQALIQGLASTRFSSTDFADFLDTLMPPPPIPLDGESTRGFTKAMNTRELLFDLYEHGRGADSGRGTKWQALNAVTEYTTHHIATRGGDREEKLFLGTIEGTGAKLNARALALLTS